MDIDLGNMQTDETQKTAMMREDEAAGISDFSF